MAEQRQPKTIDERLDALTTNMELLQGMMADVIKAQSTTDRNIKRLGRYVRTIAIDHEARLLALEGEEADE